MRDLPNGADLLALARSALSEELLPLLPQERRFEARLVAAAMAIAEREARAGMAAAAPLRRALEQLYPPDEPDPLRRLARDLRHGAFEDTPRESAARRLMWQLTFAKLRQSNPRFLVRNGFS
jgi:hypothetical protein